MYLTRCLFRKIRIGEVIPPTPNVTKVIPKLKIGVRHEKRCFSNPEGPLGRLKTMRKTVTALIKHERIELNTNRGLESRGYAERLIMEAIRNGDKHRATMELADFWLEEKQLIHKLFKVLVPRFRNYTANFTRCYGAPALSEAPRKRCIMELKGNPFPPVVIDSIPKRNLLHNILLDEARNEFRRKKEMDATTSILKDSAQSAESRAEISSATLPPTLASELEENLSSSSDGETSSDSEQTDIPKQKEKLKLNSESIPGDKLKP